MEERVLITAESVRRIARQQGLPAGIVEKDYVTSWFLKEWYENPALREGMIFKGGTALKKVYFPETWSLSHDLDFTRLGDLGSEEIKQGLEQVFRTLSRNSGITLSFQSFHSSEEAIIVSLQFMGPLVHRNRIRTDITLREKLLFAPEWREVKTVYPDLPEMRVKVYSLKEILTEKLRSIMQRGKSRDYYDVWRLLKENEFDMREINGLLVKKCRINDIPYKPELVLDEKRLGKAKRYWEKALGELTKKLPDFDTVISELKRGLVLTRKQEK